MAIKTNISWTDATWNIARGCTKVDEDCKYCYMYRDSFDSTRYNPLNVIRTKTVFNLPLKYKETKSNCWDGNPLIFTSSLTDVFHPAIDSYRNEMWDIIRKCPHLVFQILTKRPERIVDHLPPDWGKGWENVWLGTSIGSQESIGRAFLLAGVPAHMRFLSLEPLHKMINLYPLINLAYNASTSKRENAFHWVIIGGESGNNSGKYKYRICELHWIETLVDQCQQERVPVFIKQLGTHLSTALGLSDRHGSNINEFPINLRLRQFPVL